MDNHIVLNSAQCLLCGCVIFSKSRHDFVSCDCGKLSVDGGKDYPRRLFNKMSEWVDLIVYSDTPFGVIRSSLYRGSRGLNGDKPLKWVKLSEISNDYLTALIKYCIEHETLEYLSYYWAEEAYRKQNNIHIQE